MCGERVWFGGGVGDQVESQYWRDDGVVFGEIMMMIFFSQLASFTPFAERNLIG